MTTRTLTRTWYNHQPAPVDTSRYPGRVSLSRHLSGPEALPVGEPRPERIDPIGTLREIGLAGGHGSELYRMRTASHLYDDRDVDVALDLEYLVARRDGTRLADCHRCLVTHHVTPDTEVCPTCRTEL